MTYVILNTTAVARPRKPKSRLWERSLAASARCCAPRGSHWRSSDRRLCPRRLFLGSVRGAVSGAGPELRRLPPRSEVGRRSVQSGPQHDCAAGARRAGLALGGPAAEAIALIGLAHVGFDRVLGYGQIFRRLWHHPFWGFGRLH